MEKRSLESTNPSPNLYLVMASFLLREKSRLLCPICSKTQKLTTTSKKSLQYPLLQLNSSRPRRISLTLKPPDKTIWRSKSVKSESWRECLWKVTGQCVCGKEKNLHHKEQTYLISPKRTFQSQDLTKLSTKTRKTQARGQWVVLIQIQFQQELVFCWRMEMDFHLQFQLERSPSIKWSFNLTK